MNKKIKIINNKIRRTVELLYPTHEPDFIIIGAQKSGTTSLHHYLSQHPNIIASRKKETHYFDKWINYGYDRNWYKKHFRSLNKKDKTFFETTPSYIYYDTVPEKIYGYNPNIKLILILRDPVERAYSAWNMYYKIFKQNKSHVLIKGENPGEESMLYKKLFKNRTKFPSLKETIDIELDLIKEKQYKEPSIIRRGIYIDQIKNYLKYFNKEQILIIGFKELFLNTRGTFNQIYDFLDVKKTSVNKALNAMNKGNYKDKLNKNDRLFLEKFYSPYNQELFDLIERKIDW